MNSGPLSHVIDSGISTALDDETVEDFDHPCCSDRPIDVARSFARVVVDDVADPQTSAVSCCVRHEVRGPALVRPCCSWQLYAHACNPLSCSFSDLQSFFSIQTMNTFVIDHHARS